MDIPASPLLLRKYGEGKPIYCYINQEQRSWQCGIDTIACINVLICLSLAVRSINSEKCVHRANLRLSVEIHKPCGTLPLSTQNDLIFLHSILSLFTLQQVLERGKKSLCEWFIEKHQPGIPSPFPCALTCQPLSGIPASLSGSLLSLPFKLLWGNYFLWKEWKW